MRTIIKQEYDPHLLYHAINITVELQYKVPMQKVYDILSIVDKNNVNMTEKITPNEVLSLLSNLGDSLENATLPDEQNDDTNLQSKIKEILRLLGCSLSDQDLNKILKGELSLDDALSKQAKLAWLMIFEKNDDGKSYPNKEIVDHMLWCSQSIAIENIEMKIQRNLENYKSRTRDRAIGNELLLKNDNIKTLHRSEKERSDPVVLEKKRNKLRLYIAHMQGYDKDRDRDGGRGIDMNTGVIIDFGDIYIADKSNGSIIEDIGRDGIDIADIH